MKKTTMILAVVVLFVFITSCENNIFKPLHVDDPNNFDDCMSKGKAAYDSANFSEAKTWFEKAVNVNPDNSDARYSLAKTSIRLYNIDILSVALNIISKEPGEDVLEGLDPDEVLSIYKGTKGAQGHTKHIAIGLCTSGKIKPVDVYWDHAFVTTLRAVSTIFQVVNAVETVTGDVELTVTDTGLSITGWNELDQQEQDSLSTEVNEMVDDAEDTIDLIITDPEQAQDTKDLLGKLRNLGP